MTYLGYFLFLPKPGSQGLLLVGGWQSVPVQPFHSLEARGLLCL